MMRGGLAPAIVGSAQLPRPWRRDVRPRSWASALTVTTLAALCLAAAPGVVAQDGSPGASPSAVPVPSASPFCALLTAVEVGAALEADVSIVGSTATSCSYATTEGATLTVLLEAGDLATVIGAVPSAAPPSVAPSSGAVPSGAVPGAPGLTVAGLPAYVTPDGTVLYVQTSDGVLSFGALGLPGTAAETTAILEALATTAIPRLVAIPIPSAGPLASLVPLPSPAANADPGLTAMFPPTIGDRPLQVQTYTARELAANGMRPATLKAIKSGLASVGKTLDDMTFGYSSYANGDLSAVRVHGVDAASIEPQVLRLLLSGFKHPKQTPTKLHGKKVIKVTDGKGSAATDPTYFYASGDVLWEVKAPEPDLAQIMQALP